MPYTDYIVRLGDLKRAIMKNPYNPNLNIDGYMRYLKYNTPSAQKNGKWIDMGDFEQCSVCLGTRLKEFQTFYGKAIWIKTDFCPNCGARMEEK